MKVALEMPFLSFSNTNVKFTKSEKFTWRFYETIKALFTTSQIELNGKREFGNAVLDKNFETFVMYVAILETTKKFEILIYPFQIT